MEIVLELIVNKRLMIETLKLIKIMKGLTDALFAWICISYFLSLFIFFYLMFDWLYVFSIHL